MGFKPRQYDAGHTDEISKASGTTVTKYDALAWEGGYLTPATSGTTEVPYVSLETNSDSGTTAVLVVRAAGSSIIYEADTNANPVQATDVGVKADLTDKDTLNESASSNDVFQIVDIVGVESDKLVRGFFIAKTS